MEPLSRKELAEIVERDLPGHELASEETHPEDAPASEADEPGVDIAALRQKFLGEGAADDSAGLDALTTPVNEHDYLVAVRPKDAGGDPFDEKARPKAVVVSGRDKRVVGRQG